MSSQENSFRQRLLATFKVEAQEHFKTIASGLVRLETPHPPEAEREIVETIFRAAHNLKGAARAVNITDIEALCRSLEDVFEAWKQKGARRSPECFDTLHRVVDIMRVVLYSLEEGGAPVAQGQILSLVQEMAAIESQKQGPGERGEGHRVSALSPVQQPPASAAETVRISTEKLNALLLQAEEMVSAKSAAGLHHADLRELASMFTLLKKECARVSVDAAGSQKDSLIWIKAHIKAMEEKFTSMKKAALQHSKSVDRMVDSLLADVKGAAVLPFSTILEGFPLLVRNIVRDQGKEVELRIQGEGIEIDRRILEEIKDPLIHLLRNSMDHGIETPEKRVGQGKARWGVIKISVSQRDAGKVEIIVSDDGKGIDPAKVRDAAVRDGQISQAEADSLDEQGVLSLSFRSGVSTSPRVTDLSGRGLGLAIVREKVEKLRGVISIESNPGAGTVFRMLLPTTAATFRGVLVRVSGQVFILPTMNVERVVRIRDEEIRTVENRETICLGGCPLSYVRLENILELPLKRLKNKAGGDSGYTSVLVLAVAERRIAFGVDEILREEEVLVQGLGRQLSRVRNVAGAAVSGSGSPAPVLNVADLMRSALKMAVAGMPAEAPAELPGRKRRAILVVEDSITSRILLKNILESAGYDVRTAVDGIDAMTTLKTEVFDLVVSDIDMPRMDGFELTERIRAEKGFSGLPIVLITALEKREDRERGISAGANAYMVKSSFNQSNLLEIVRRLI